MWTAILASLIAALAEAGLGLLGTAFVALANWLKDKQVLSADDLQYFKDLITSAEKNLVLRSGDQRWAWTWNEALKYITEHGLKGIPTSLLESVLTQLVFDKHWGDKGTKRLAGKEPSTLEPLDLHL